MTWWLWILLGLALLIAEAAVDAAFFLLFIGLGAILVGVGVGLGELLGIAWPPVAQWLIFAGLSLVFLYFLRARLRAAFLRKKGAEVDIVVGEQARALMAIAPGAEGEAMLRGAKWAARNLGTAEIPAGARVRVAEVDQLVLGLKPQ